MEEDELMCVRCSAHKRERTRESVTKAVTLTFGSLYHKSATTTVKR